MTTLRTVPPVRARCYEALVSAHLVTSGLVTALKALDEGTDTRPGADDVALGLVGLVRVADALLPPLQVITPQEVKQIADLARAAEEQLAGEARRA